MRAHPLSKIFVFEYLSGGGIDAGLALAGSIAELGALIDEGRAMRDALVRDLRALDGVEVCHACSRFEIADSSSAHCMAAPGESMHAFVARVAREHDYAWIVAPECDGLLLDLHDAVAAVGPERWIGCEREAIRIASSKRATAERLAAHGIAVTPALEPRDGASADAARWVVKPDDGAGALDTFVFDDFAAACAEYDARAAARRNPVLQAWVDGAPLSVSLICDGARAELVSVNRQRIGVKYSAQYATKPATKPADAAAAIVECDGVSVNAIGVASREGRVLDALAQRVVRALPGLRGFVGIDVVWEPVRGPVVIEVNPRLTLAYAALSRTSAALGAGLARAVLAAHRVPAARRDANHDATRDNEPACGARP